MYPTSAPGAAAASSPALFVLKAHGDVDRLDTLTDFDGTDASVVEQDVRWTLEVVIRADSLVVAERLGQEIVNEASFYLGDWNGWHVSGLTDGAAT